jgi:hypothetical protein
MRAPPGSRRMADIALPHRDVLGCGMQSIQAELTAHCLSPAGHPAIRVGLPAGRSASPGQPWLARTGDPVTGTLQPLYPVRLLAQGFEAEIESAEEWRLGSTLELLGPIGSGFRPPRNSRRWLLASLRGDLSRLFPLLQDGLARGAAVAAWSDSPMAQLPAAVEVLPGLREGLEWADYVALDADPETLPRWQMVAGDVAEQRSYPPGEVLLDLPMLCGFGGCLTCFVSTRNGWKLACKDGPVFPLAEVVP